MAAVCAVNALAETILFFEISGGRVSFKNQFFINKNNAL